MGQLVIEIDDRDTQAQVQKARAGLREVQDVQEEIDQNIRAAESAREAAEAGRSLAAATFKRNSNLLEQKSVSQQEFDEVQAKLKVADAEVDLVLLGHEGLEHPSGPGHLCLCNL